METANESRTDSMNASEADQCRAEYLRVGRAWVRLGLYVATAAVWFEAHVSGQSTPNPCEPWMDVRKMRGTYTIVLKGTSADRCQTYNLDNSSTGSFELAAQGPRLGDP